MIQGVLSGIGFLGAGTIIQSRGTVHGVTTAAGIGVTGAIGVACGFGLYFLAGVITAMAFLILRGFGFLERRMWPERKPAEDGNEKAFRE